jgi:succinate-acetate transporter protein
MLYWFIVTLAYRMGALKIKRFFETFVICFIMCIILLFFGALIFQSVIATIATVALFFTILISIYIELQTKIEELENRIKALEPLEEQDEAVVMQENENKLV